MMKRDERMITMWALKLLAVIALTALSYFTLGFVGILIVWVICFIWGLLDSSHDVKKKVAEDRKAEGDNDQH